MSIMTPHRPDPNVVHDLAVRVLAKEGLRATAADADRVGTAEMWPELLTLDSAAKAALLEAIADRIAEIRTMRAARS